MTASAHKLSQYFAELVSEDIQDNECTKSAPTPKVSISDTAEKHKKENFQGVGICTLFKKNPTGRSQPHHRAGKPYRRMSRLTTKPEKGRAGKRRTSNVDHLIYASDGDNQYNG